MATAVVMPKAGNSVEECLLAKWRVQVGDAVKVGDVVCDIETDKSAIEVESTDEGTVLALFWNEGDLVPVLENILALGNPGEDASSLKPGGGQEAPEKAAAEDAVQASAPVASAAASAAVQAATTDAASGPLSPRARKFVAEHPFVLPAGLSGSGAGGRIMEQDVAAAYQSGARLSPVAAALQDIGMMAPEQGSGLGGMVRGEDMKSKLEKAVAPAAPAPAMSLPAVAPATGDDVITEKPFPQIRKIIASRLHESLSSMAQYTLNAEADATGLLALRQRLKAQGESLQLANVNIGDMVMFAVIKALQKHPEMNAEFGDNVLRMHSAVHMGFACDTPRGLMVPVLHYADRMSLAQMAETVKVLAKQANDGSLNPDLMSGGTFTVSNLGAFGITTFTPVINAPQVAILGVCKTILRPVRNQQGTIEYRDFMQFSLTLNHMVVDGAPGAKFLQTLKNIVENFDLVCVAG